MNSFPSDPSSWSDEENDDERQPSFEEMARALQNMLGGGQVDPALAAQLGLPSDPAMLRQMMSQAQAMFTSASDPESSWARAREQARTLAGTPDPESPADLQVPDESAVDSAFRMAGLWLDEKTGFAALPVQARTFTPRQWAEASFGAFREMTEPMSGSVAEAMQQSLAAQVPEEMRAMLGSAAGMMKGMGQAVFAQQLGQGVGVLAKEVLSTSDIGVPLVRNQLGLVPQNVAAFAQDLEIPMDEVLIYLALREDAHARLFARAPWLSAHVSKAIRDFASGVSIDMGHMEEIARSVDPNDPESIQNAIGGGMFEPANTPAQTAALEELETLLALIEGWVDALVNESAFRLPHKDALAEVIRRRRATSGPAEQTFQSLVGLQLRPRRLREAAALFHFIQEQEGPEGRERIWTHPDLLPTAADLDDPAGYSERRKAQAEAEASFDEDLEKLLSGGYEEPKKESSDTEEDPESEKGKES